MHGYSSQQTAKLLGMSVTEVLAYVRAGFLNPERGHRREYRFGFQDLVLLRTAKALMANQIAPKAVRRAWALCRPSCQREPHSPATK
jgi:DNA-binding transcriptional MerR regulator